MKSSSSTAVLKTKGLYAVLFVLLGLLGFMKVRSSPSVAQSEERILKAEIPEHLPFKVKMSETRRLAFKRLDNDRWLRDFEIEVTNTGDKPIYYLYLLVRLPETKTYLGTTLMYPLYYGRRELSDIETKAEPDDIPIKPGATHIFTIHRGQVLAWEKAVREKSRPQAKMVELAFQKLSFGDRSGFVGSDGQKVPHTPFKKTALSRCDDQPNRRRM